MPPKKKEEEKPKIKWGRVSNTLKMGLVGLPNVGKSLTFNILTRLTVPSANYPFCTIDPHEAVVQVPDERFDWLSANFKPASNVKSVLNIWDIAGLVPNAHKGEGLGNAFLSNIQAVDGIYHVCRAFEDTEIQHTEGEVNPVRDLDIIRNELIQKDLAFCAGKLDEAQKKLKATPKARTWLAWALEGSGGYGPISRAQPAHNFKSPIDRAQYMGTAVTSVCASWSTLSLNVPDFTRFAKSPRDQALGQTLGMPVAM